MNERTEARWSEAGAKCRKIDSRMERNGSVFVGGHIFLAAPWTDLPDGQVQFFVTHRDSIAYLSNSLISHLFSTHCSCYGWQAAR